MSEKTDEKINDLHLAVAKMKQQQDELHRKLKVEQEKKEKLEVCILLCYEGGYFNSVRLQYVTFVIKVDVEGGRSSAF